MDIGAGLGFEKNTPLARSQTDIFVNAALGSDSNDGTPGSPLRTFQEAVNRADESYHPGANNIFLAPGTYEGVYISDYDLLKVFGQGGSPSDVTIRDFGDVIRINGGSDVRLFNMEIDGFGDETLSGSHGIYADNLDYLYLNGVVSRDNFGSGLYAEYVTKVKLYHSTFEDNYGFGAYIYEGYKVRSVGSDFSYNGNDGIRTDYYDRVEMIASTAHNNGWFGDNMAEGESDVDGFEANYVDSVLVNGGSYDYNDRRGIDLDNQYDITITGVQASWNGDRGVDADQFFETADIHGGVFKYNGNDGVNLQGFQEFQAEARGAETNGPIVSVYGGIYWNNGDDGLDVEDVYKANFYGIDARFNGDDGAEIQRAGHGFVSGGYLFDNYEHGLELRFVGYSIVNGLASLQNGEDGLNMLGGDRLNVLGGEYSNNGDHGIRASGDFEAVNAEGTIGNSFELLDRVDIKYATVLNNYDGVHVLYSYLTKMVGGTYSENSNYGVELDNVNYGIFQDIVVINNGSHGLLFEAGLFDDFLEEGGSEYLGGPNWNRLEFVGGLYANNGDNGILISTNRNQGWNVNQIEVEARYVVARDNGEDGFGVGRDFFNGPVLTEGGQFGFGSNLEIEMVGGYYGFNGDDGIDLLDRIDIAAVEGLPQFGGFLVGSFTDVVAEFNYDDGIDASGVVRDFIDNLPGFMGDGGNGNGGTLLQFTRGSYSHNGDHGMELDYAIFSEFGMPCIEGRGGNEFYSLASFEHVVAVNNGYNGVLFDVFVSQFDHGGGKSVAGSEGNGNGGYPPLFDFYGGVFNNNGRNGIKLTSDFEFVDVAEGGVGSDILVARLQNVEASLNGRNGALIRNFDPDFFRGDVDIINGVYNSNGKDGLHVRGFDELYVDHIIAIANGEDGVHSRDNWSTYISDDSIIVSNGSQNVRIN